MLWGKSPTIHTEIVMRILSTHQDLNHYKTLNPSYSPNEAELGDCWWRFMFPVVFHLAFVLNWNPNILIRLPWNNTPLESLWLSCFYMVFQLLWCRCNWSWYTLDLMMASKPWEINDWLAIPYWILPLLFMGLNVWG